MNPHANMFLQRYKYRLIVDESLSLGVMGPNGRGVADHFGIKPGAVEILGASLGECSCCRVCGVSNPPIMILLFLAGTAVASIGGFCAGDREIVDHQRLSGLGYCFSASSPPYTAQGKPSLNVYTESPGEKSGDC